MRFDRWRYILPLRLRSIVSGADADRELDDELAFHLERQIEANLASGMAPAEARAAAIRALGGIEQRKEECRDARGVSTIENVSRDVRIAVRQLARQPAFTAAAVLSLGLGIGANSAIFQLLNALTFRPLPVETPHELVEVRLTGDGRDGRHTGRNRQVSLPQYEAIARRQEAFSSMLAFGDTRFNLSPQGEVRYVDGLWVSGSFFDTLGVKPILGRLIGPDDDRPGCGAPVAVISYPLWQREYGGRPDVIGQIDRQWSDPHADHRRHAARILRRRGGPPVRHGGPHLLVAPDAARPLVARRDRAIEAGLDTCAGGVASSRAPARHPARHAAQLP